MPFCFFIEKKGDLFLGKPAIFWTGVEALGVIATVIVLIITGIFIYRQLKMAVRTFRFDGIRQMQELVDSFRDQRKELFDSFSLEIILSLKQFADHPPSRHVEVQKSAKEQRRMALTEKQRKALNNLKKDQIELAKNIIGRLNDLGQLAEDGLVSYHVMLSKYHTMIIRLCHTIEPVRRMIEDQQGGNYGQRLLRMRHSAVRYNTIIPKHRSIEIDIFTPHGKKMIIPIIKANPLKRLVWYFQRILRIY